MSMWINAPSTSRARFWSSAASRDLTARCNGRFARVLRGVEYDDVREAVTSRDGHHVLGGVRGEERPVRGDIMPVRRTRIADIPARARTVEDEKTDSRRPERVVEISGHDAVRQIRPDVTRSRALPQRASGTQGDIGPAACVHEA